MDGHSFKNPYAMMHPDDIRAAISDLNDVKRKALDFIADIAAMKIDGFDVGDLSDYMDAAITDTVDTSIRLAADELYDQGESA